MVMKKLLSVAGFVGLAFVVQSFVSIQPPALPAPATLRPTYVCESDCGTQCETRNFTLTAGVVPGATAYEWQWKFAGPAGGHCANQAPSSFVTTSNVATDIYLPGNKLTLMVRAKSGSESSAWKSVPYNNRPPNKICP